MLKEVGAVEAGGGDGVPTVELGGDNATVFLGGDALKSLGAPSAFDEPNGC